PKSLDYIEKHIAFYRMKKTEQEVLTASDTAIQENSLSDVTLFYLEGFEQDPSKYAPERAYRYFRGIESGKPLGPMLKRYATLLKAHDHDQALHQWKDLLMEEEIRRPETLDTLLVAFEYEKQRKRFDKIKSLGEDFVRFYTKNIENI